MKRYDAPPDAVWPPPMDDVPITGAPAFPTDGTETLVPIHGTDLVVVLRKKPTDLRSDR